MAFGAKNIRFGKRKSDKGWLFVLIIVILLAVIGVLGWTLVKDKFSPGPGPAETADGSGVGSGAPEDMAAGREDPDREARPSARDPQAGTGQTAAGPAGAEQAGTGSAASPAVPRLGVESSVRQILDSVMGLWLAALAKGDFTEFHQMISTSWQQKDSPSQLKASYGVLAPYIENLKLFPSRGKLVLLESKPFSSEGQEVADSVPSIRDSLGPESPWLVKGEWRVNKTALGFTLVLSLENGQWRPTGLKVEIFN
ncbi:MAG: hypothetical protein LBJ61_12510 [Deltaproteobacteria bacterium]|jgi:hypothetical protein|nr:hypothetical protein [Deltaproteobacteria bacterium]